MRAALALLFGMAPLLAACNQQMAEQPRYNPLDASNQFADGRSARMPVAGTIDRSADLAAASQTIPYPITLALLQHGRERFEIFCAPCHGRAGDGRGVIPRHGFPSPPSYHQDALRQASDRHFYDVITNGYGVMYSYRSRVPPADRWAIVAYIRALQYSRHAPVAELSGDLKAKLQGEAAP
ncbi:cytochrome c [Mesorhizobium sp. B2-8-9]|uniref:c-type cytochrome n=1 Tax=Mesorhizobium sp. B2-8-9 TaxID=2589899 RepID=UPI001AEE4EB0|nr:cytochrome c [Mesorhizobium sp. B2-8-9]